MNSRENIETSKRQNLQPSNLLTFMILTYEAVDANGRSKKDTLEAPSKQEAAAQLRRDGLFVVSITEASDGPKRRAGHDPQAGRPEGKGGSHRLPIATLVLFTRQMTMMLRSGSSIVPAVVAIRRQMTKPEHAAILDQIIVDLEEGVTLTEALRKHPRSFDAVYCAVVAAGEASASLPVMFERLANDVSKRRLLRNKVMGALAYPVLLILMSMHIFLALLFFVVPRFHDMFDQLGVEAPASTKMLLATGGFLSEHWVLILGVVFSMIGLTVAGAMSRAGRQWLTNVQTQIPIVGKLRARLIQAQVFRTMGTLLESRVGVLDALELVRGTTRNNRFQDLFNTIEECVTSGGSLSSACEQSNMVEPYICQAIQTGEESGSIGEAMLFSSDILDETNTELLITVMKLLEPVILIAMGFVVGGVAISLFMPLFDLTAALQ